MTSLFGMERSTAQRGAVLTHVDMSDVNLLMFIEYLIKQR